MHCLATASITCRKTFSPRVCRRGFTGVVRPGTDELKSGSQNQRKPACIATSSHIRFSDGSSREPSRIIRNAAAGSTDGRLLFGLSHPFVAS